MSEFCTSSTLERVVINWSNVQCTDIPKSIIKITRHSLQKVIQTQISEKEYIVTVQTTKLKTNVEISFA